MPRKVLISFVGTGPTTQADAGNYREYRTAKYKFDSIEQPIECSFIASALKQVHQIDTIILIGTVKSMWEEVYHAFAGEQTNDKVYFKIAEHCSNAKHTSSLEIPCQSEIETALGGQSKVVLINYGLNQEEIRHNQETILNIEQYLNSGDELYIDVTHSFRSLPLFLMNTLIYLKNVSRKQINIRSISYGMLDVTRELGHTPVVELNPTLDTIDWIIGAYNYKEFGNAYKICDLLSSKGNRQAAQLLEAFTLSKDLNHLSSLSSQAQRLTAINPDNFSTIEHMAIDGVTQDFIRQFGAQNLRIDRLQFRLAQYHHEKRNYGFACIVLVEALYTYICLTERLDPSIKENRESIKNPRLIRDNYPGIYEILETKQLRSIRNALAHNIAMRRPLSDAQIKNTIRESIALAKQIIDN